MGSTDLTTLMGDLLDQLRIHKMTLAVAESATGGFLSNAITNIEGSSRVYLGGVVCYSAFMKNNILAVDFDIINEYGAISPETTEALLEGLKEAIGADLRIAITGVTGSVPVEGKARGLMYIGVGSQSCNKVIECHFAGNREEIKAQTALRAVEFLLEQLESLIP